jgi:hypothetical protein
MEQKGIHAHQNCASDAFVRFALEKMREQSRKKMREPDHREWTGGVYATPDLRTRAFGTIPVGSVLQQLT